MYYGHTPRCARSPAHAQYHGSTDLAWAALRCMQCLMMAVMVMMMMMVMPCSIKLRNSPTPGYSYLGFWMGACYLGMQRKNGPSFRT